MEAVHDEARARGAERVWLEVIVENVQPIALYEAARLRARPRRGGLVARGRGEAAAECPPEEAHAWIRAPHRARAVAARRCLCRPPGRRPWAGGRRRGGARARRRRTRERPPARGARATRSGSCSRGSLARRSALGAQPPRRTPWRDGPRCPGRTRRRPPARAGAGALRRFSAGPRVARALLGHEPDPTVRGVAERLRPRLPAAAERDRTSPPGSRTARPPRRRS